MDAGDRPVIAMLEREAVRGYRRGLLWGFVYGGTLAAIILRW